MESSQAIETAERMKAMAAMGPGRMGPGMRGGRMAGRQGTGVPQAEAGEKKAPSNRFRLHTEDTGELITSLVDFSRANSLKMNILNVNPPSLEDAFVMLTGGEKREIQSS